MVMEWLPAGTRRSAIERKLAAGQILFSQGQPTAGLYDVLSGKIKLVRVDPSGRETVLSIAGAGGTIAEASLFSPTYHCHAIAATNAVVRLYPKADLVAAFERDPNVAQSFMALLARQVMDLRTRLERRNIHSARDRVRHYLVAHAGVEARTVVLPSTLKDLAAELGLTHETLYRTLSGMEADGEIARAKDTISLAGRLSDRDHR
jgi:CRP/FNR family transcriptional regulator, dissimilatory nitrate respiration regulator